MKDATCFTDLDLIIEVCYGAQNSLADLNTKDSWESLGQQGNETSNPKGIQPWIFTGRIAAEAPILWLPDMMSWLIGKDPDAGKDWRQEKGTTEDEMVGWHHRLDGHEFEAGSGSWWWTGKPGMLQPMRLQRVGHWTELITSTSTACEKAYLVYL